MQLYSSGCDTAAKTCILVPRIVVFSTSDLGRAGSIPGTEQVNYETVLPAEFSPYTLPWAVLLEADDSLVET